MNTLHARENIQVFPQCISSVRFISLYVETKKYHEPFVKPGREKQYYKDYASAQTAYFIRPTACFSFSTVLTNDLGLTFFTIKMVFSMQEIGM